MFSFVKFTDFNFYDNYMNVMNNGQMDRGNENPTQHLPYLLRKPTKKPVSGWSAPGFEPGIFSLVSTFSQKNKTYKIGLGVCVPVRVCVCVCVQFWSPPNNFQTSYPTDTKFC